MTTDVDLSDIDAITVVAGEPDPSLPRVALAELAHGAMRVAVVPDARSGPPYHVAAAAIEDARRAVSERRGLSIVFAIDGPLAEVWSMALADRRAALVSERTPPPPPPEPPARGLLQVLADEVLDRLRRDDGEIRANAWDAAITPPFPEVWPPDGTGRLLRYVWAHAHAHRLNDGLHTSVPFAAIVIDPRDGAPPEVIVLTDRLERLGIMGFGPVNRPHAMPALDPERGAERLRALWDPTADARDREANRVWYAARWYDHNPDLGAWVAERHPAFHAWLRAT